MVARRQIGYADAVIMGAVGLSGTALARRSQLRAHARGALGAQPQGPRR